MAAADYRLMTEATGQRIALALENLAGFGAYLTTADVVNNLTSSATNAPLSAAQGKALNEAIPLSTKLGGKQVQWGHKEISLAANSQTEITVTMPLSYQGGNDYMAIATPVIYTAANSISCVIRDKISTSFVVRIYNAAGSAANGYLDWITIGL